jgi:hypothetical protein
MCNILDSQNFHFSLWTCNTLCGNVLDVFVVFHLSYELVAIYVVMFYTIREFQLSLWTCNNWFSYFLDVFVLF